MRLGVAFAALLSIVLPGLHAQIAGDFNAPPAKTRSYVVYAAEQQAVTAGKNSVLQLNFHVVNGFHVNSHTPKSELLIPTKITLQSVAGVRIAATQYPAGTAYTLSADPTETLDVYTGDFTIKLPVVAEAGEHTISGTLHYQACDQAACYPPKSLPVQLVFTAK
jgi:DsbC/DsbD-like thiol-disulfide interchange protein